MGTGFPRVGLGMVAGAPTCSCVSDPITLDSPQSSCSAIYIRIDFFVARSINYTERNVLKSPTMTMDLPISSFNSVHFAPCILKLCH